MKNGHIYVRVALDLSRFQARYLELGTDLENGLFCDLVDREVEEGFVVFKLLYDVKKNRIPIQEIQVKNGSMSLMKNVYWEFDKLPHMLIAGGTGGQCKWMNMEPSEENEDMMENMFQGQCLFKDYYGRTAKMSIECLFDEWYGALETVETSSVATAEEKYL